MEASGDAGTVQIYTPTANDKTKNEEGDTTPMGRKGVYVQ
jgi:hypothetical protein